MRLKRTVILTINYYWILKINNFMKAKATLFAILFGMISMVGFGNTTDLSENSNTIDVVCFDAPKAMVCVDYQLNEIASLPTKNLFIVDIGNTQISTGFKTNLNVIEKPIYYNQKFLMFLPDIYLTNISNYIKTLHLKNPNYGNRNRLCFVHYRVARDGLVKPNNFIG